MTKINDRERVFRPPIHPPYGITDGFMHVTAILHKTGKRFDIMQ